MNKSKKKRKAPEVPPSNGQKSQWPSGATYVPKDQSFEEFAKENFVEGTARSFVPKEIKRPLLVYTPEKEKDDVVRVWRVLIRYMGDIVDYRSRMDFESHQPELGSVMTRICRQLGQNSAANPFGPPPAKLDGPLVPEGEGLHVLPTKPRLGTLRKLKNTIALRLFGKGRKTVFHLLPLEETLLTDLDKIQYIIGYGILRPRIRDELYCGVCRQLTDNPHKKSVEKGWVLLNLMAACFTPTHRCLSSILDFLDHGPKIFSASAKKLLQITAATGGRIHPPSRLEYEAVRSRSPVELTIHLMDGSTFTFPADGTTSVGEICLAIATKLGITNSFGFHLFITNRNKVSSLCLNDHLMDSVAQLEQIARDYTLSEEESAWRLYYRKEVFAPWEEFSLEPAAANLIYSQVKRGVLLRETACPTESDFIKLLTQICYVERGGTLDVNFLQNDIIPQIIWHMNDASSFDPEEVDFEQEQNSEHVEQFKLEMTQKVSEAFEVLYADAESKPNSFNVKLELIEFARKEFSENYKRMYDITVVIDTGELMEGAMRISIQEAGISLVSEDDLVIENISFMDIQELGEEKNEDELHPHSVVLKLLSGRDLVIVSQDSPNIRDMLTYLMVGLIERSKYAVAIMQNTATKVDDLDLEPGDLLLLDKKSMEKKNSHHSNNNNNLVMRAKNKRTGQVGMVTEEMFHILPTITEPEGKTVESYQEYAHDQGELEAVPLE